MRQIVFSEQVKANIRAVPQQTAMQILTAIHRLAKTGVGWLRTLKGQGGEERLRVGDFRVRFTEEPWKETEQNASTEASRSKVSSGSMQYVTAKKLTAD